MHSQEDRALRRLWGLQTPSARGPKSRWTLAEVTGAAVALAEQDGLESLTLARVAARLGMTTTALYRYVDSKAELVELMVDAAIGDPPRLDAADWRERAREWTRALAAVHRRHPWLSEVAPRRMPTQPHAYAWIDALVVALRGEVAGDPLRIALLLDSLVRTYAAMGRGLTAEAPASWLVEVVAERFPGLVPSQDAPDAAAELDFAVEAVLAGIR